MATILGPVPLSEFSNLCRLCGSKTSVLMGLHIFEREGDLRQIYKKITECLPIQVHGEDKLPKMVCEECVYKLDELFEFRERSIKTEYLLNDMLRSVYICNETMSMNMDSLMCEQPAPPPPHKVELPGGEGISEMNDSQEGKLKLKSSGCALLLKVAAAHLGQPTQFNGEFAASPTGSDSTPLSLPEAIDPNLQVQPIVSLEGVKCGGDVEEHVEGEWYFCDVCGQPSGSRTCDAHWTKCNVCGVACASQTALALHLREAHPPSPTHPPTTSHPPCHCPSLTGEKGKCNSCEGSGTRTQSCQVCGKHSGGVPCAHQGRHRGAGGETEAVEPATAPTHADLPDRPLDSKPGKSCPECGKVYRTNYKLAEHMRRHTGEKPFKCSTCEKAFRSKIGLAQHEAQHTGQYEYSCSTCGKGFQCKSYLIVHQRVHSDVKPYPCDTCGQNFKTKQSLVDHQNRHMGIKPYLCEICGRGFITKGLCKAHQKVHSGTDNRQYPCQVCNKLFVSKSYLTTHLRIHTGEKPFMCEVCGKGFLTRVDLRVHSTMHTGEKSFVCELCGKAFARRDALRCHRRSHTDCRNKV